MSVYLWHLSLAVSVSTNVFQLVFYFFYFLPTATFFASVPVLFFFWPAKASLLAASNSQEYQLGMPVLFVALIQHQVAMGKS